MEIARTANDALARYCGAEVDFVDIDPRSFNLSVAALEKKFAAAAGGGRLPTVLVPVHFAGQPADMRALGELAAHHGTRVIEDASHALGAEYRGGRTGNCAHSDITVLSFHPVKIITSGEGGMALTNRDDLYQSMLRLRTALRTKEPSVLKTQMR